MQCSSHGPAESPDMSHLHHDRASKQLYTPSVIFNAFFFVLFFAIHLIYFRFQNLHGKETTKVLFGSHIWLTDNDKLYLFKFNRR